MKINPRLATALVAVIGIALSGLADLYFFDHKENLFFDKEYLFAGSGLLLFWVGFGFVGCVGIVVISKWVGHAFLMKHDDPYTGEHVEAEPEEHRDG